MSLLTLRVEIQKASRYTCGRDEWMSVMKKRNEQQCQCRSRVLYGKGRLCGHVVVIESVWNHVIPLEVCSDGDLDMMKYFSHAINVWFHLSVMPRGEVPRYSDLAGSHTRASGTRRTITPNGISRTDSDPIIFLIPTTDLVDRGLVRQFIGR